MLWRGNLGVRQWSPFALCQLNKFQRDLFFRKKSSIQKTTVDTPSKYLWNGYKLMPKETTAPAEISELSRETKARVKRRVEKRLRGLELESTGFLTAHLNQIQGHGRITLVVLVNEERDARDEHLWGQCYHHLCVVRYVVPIGNQPMPLPKTVFFRIIMANKSIELFRSHVLY